MKKKWISITAIILLLTFFNTFALADDWTCPTCGRANNDDMNFCGNCRTAKPDPDPVPSSMSNAWVCSGCNHICPDGDNFCTKCGTDHYDTDSKAMLMDRPVIGEVQMSPCTIQRIPCSFVDESIAVYYTANVDGSYYFWLEDQISSFSAKMILYDGNKKKLRANEFYDNDPGFTYRLSAGQTYGIELNGRDGGNPYYTLCIGEPRTPEFIEARCVIQDSMDYYCQGNTYLFIPQLTGKYRLEITEMQKGQEVDLKVQDELGYNIQSSSMGVSMGSGISFELEANKLYYIIAEQRTGWHGKNLGYYKLQLSSPNPVISVNGCTAIGDYLYYNGQMNTYDYTASDTGTYSFSFEFTDAACEFRIKVLDEYGYTVGESRYSSSCSADLTAGKNYQIIVSQQSGFGNYSLFIHKGNE